MFGLNNKYKYSFNIMGLNRNKENSKDIFEFMIHVDEFDKLIGNVWIAKSIIKHLNQLSKQVEERSPHTI